MSKSGFDAEDFSLTLARFNNKCQNIIHDESRLERQVQEPVTLSSATHDCGAAKLTSLASILTVTPEQKNVMRNGSKEKEKKRKIDTIPITTTNK
ncbi:hypothetical protein HW114_12055 [Serratia symbiotica]|uniref:hypothetical protein n=1 Tax=Serratia symbiotica TaxID=138074 RepID=UPI001320C5E8|nr:hypothetical protein [Serratia symbiotica]MBF1996166.1 hypothetical protein [Serratia symbiotica]MBQ0955268.1 hypothetical protein [Serratia symbiotica]QTP14616.1 hypothetical protein GPZ83_0015360 [Serratia symbiotica]